MKCASEGKIPVGPARPVCPCSGGAGQAVKWSTMAALSSGPLPQRQKVALCLDPSCEVVYFGDRDLRLRIDEVKMIPGFKAAGDGTVCYCFLHRREQIARELRHTGRGGIAAGIRNQIVNNNCACEVRNPSGRCCLGEVEAIVKRVREESTS